MILSRADLRQAVKEGKVAFDPPLEEGQWGEASVDLRLGYQFTTLVNQENVTISVADGLKPVEQSNLWNTDDLRKPDLHGRPRFHEIRRGDFVLAQTYETIRVPRNMIARVEGRSTYARVGLSMHQTAPWIQPGWSGPIILELMNNGPLTIKLTPTKDRPCQLTFFKLTSEVPEEYAYGAKARDTYQDQNHPLKPKRQ